MKKQTDGPADWQCGIDITVLKERADIFLRRQKPHIYGAFGLTNEAAVAAAISTGHFFYNDRAALICHGLKNGSAHYTYSGEKICMAGGDLFINSFAADTPAAGVDLLNLHRPAPRGGLLRDNPATWVEIFEEDPVTKTAVQAAGFEYVGTKILAGSEIKGLYCRGRTVEIPTAPADTATLSILIPDFCRAGELEKIRKSIARYTGWAQHYSNYNKNKSWTAFALRGYTDDPAFVIKPAEMSRKWKAENAGLLENRPRDTTAAGDFPEIFRTVERLPGFRPGGAERVRLMRLAPGGGELTRHADITNRAAGTADGCIARLHIPLMTNRAVVLTQWNRRGEKVIGRFRAGELCYLDQRQPHTVTNDGDTDRVHLVVDMKSNAELRQLIAAGAL